MSQSVSNQCPLGSVYLSGLFSVYAYRLSAWGLPGSGTRVSGWVKRPSAGSYHRAL
ncbi:MAG: hypothetical protein Kow00123_13550 [Anaerolineales bacterium]